MKNKLSCEQVIALLTFYLDGKLHINLIKSIEEHLKNCSSCREVYSAAGCSANSTRFEFKNSENLHNDLSAYIDNELSDADAVRIRKITITNPVARKDLENMYALRKEIQNSFERVKNECKTDYSKIVLNIMQGGVKPFDFRKLVFAFTAMMSVVVAGFIAMLYF